MSPITQKQRIFNKYHREKQGFGPGAVRDQADQVFLKMTTKRSGTRDRRAKSVHFVRSPKI